MRFLHLSDLHIGKQVNNFSLLDDQRHVLRQVIDICKKREVDAVVIAGDVYDRGVPSSEATQVLDDLLTSLVALRIPCLIISGNHDSPERLGFGGRIMRDKGINLSCLFSGMLDRVVLHDDVGPVNFYLMPFMHPAQARTFFPDDKIASYDDMARRLIATVDVDPSERNVLVAHQFVTAGSTLPERSDSESPSIGGLDNVDASAFDTFDYVALGHIHGPQRIGRDTIRYAGSPLKYSFSEVHQRKGACLVTMGDKGDVSFEMLPLAPRHDMRAISGPFDELISSEVVSSADNEDYLFATLTDEEDVVDAITKLRRVYPNIMGIAYDNTRSRTSNSDIYLTDLPTTSPIELFEEFYLKQTGRELSEDRCDLAREALEQTEGECS